MGSAICASSTTTPSPGPTMQAPLGTASASRCSPLPSSWPTRRTTMKRRTFLQSLGVGAGAFMLHSMLRPKSANAAVDRSFVFCYFRGGWDTLLSLDPRDPNVFTDARRNETLIELGWDQ